MNNFKKIILIPTFLLFTFGVLFAELSADVIAKRAYNIEDGYDIKAVMMMKIVKSNGKVKKRDIIFYRKDYGKDNRTLIRFRSPADIRGTSFLTWNHTNRDNDQWLYLPALHKVKRIGASRKSKSFMKSDFSYDDLSRRKLDRDTFTLIRSEVYHSSPCYVLQAVAKNSSEKYIKRLYWIRKDSFVIVRIDMFTASNEITKRFYADKIKKINNIWTVTSATMKNLKTGGQTTISLSQVRYNSGLPGRLFNKGGLMR